MFVVAVSTLNTFASGNAVIAHIGMRDSRRRASQVEDVLSHPTRKEVRDMLAIAVFYSGHEVFSFSREIETDDKDAVLKYMLHEAGFASMGTEELHEIVIVENDKVKHHWDPEDLGLHELDEEDEEG
jgi:hypothetical protein